MCHSSQLDWSWSDDSRVLEFKLRPGVKFHDGEPFNAAAVKYTLERYRNIRGSSWVTAYAPISKSKSSMI